MLLLVVLELSLDKLHSVTLLVNLDLATFDIYNQLFINVNEIILAASDNGLSQPSPSNRFLPGCEETHYLFGHSYKNDCPGYHRKANKNVGYRHQKR